jgi:hypothetical protein
MAAVILAAMAMAHLVGRGKGPPHRDVIINGAKRVESIK